MHSWPKQIVCFKHEGSYNNKANMPVIQTCGIIKTHSLQWNDYLCNLWPFIPIMKSGSHVCISKALMVSSLAASYSNIKWVKLYRPTGLLFVVLLQEASEEEGQQLSSSFLWCSQLRYSFTAENKTIQIQVRERRDELVEARGLY